MLKATISLTKIWENWSKEFLDLPAFPMSQETSRLYVGCFMEEKGGDSDFPGLEVEESFPYQVLSKRAEYVGVKITKVAMTFLTTLCHGPGDIVMYVYVLKYIQEREKLEKITMGDIAMTFPVGFPGEEQMKLIWDKQKGFAHALGSGNILDQLGPIETTL